MNFFYNFSPVISTSRQARRHGIALAAFLLLIIPQFSFAVGPPECNCDGNLLSNGGFEQSGSWTIASGGAARATSYSMCGTYYAYLYSSSTSSRIYQDVYGVAPNVEYELSFFAGVHYRNHGQAVRVYYYRSNGSQIGGYDETVVSFEVGNQYGLAHYNMSFVTPDETSYIRVQLRADRSYYLKIDGMCLAESAGAAVLPVELAQFSARPTIDDQVQLNWTTASESENEGFEIQRSYDARDREAIGFVDGHGTVNTPQNYTFRDDRPLFNNVIYYRLKQMDFGGAHEFFQVVHVILDKMPTATLTLYPNPVQEDLNIITAEGTLVIINPLGKVVKQQYIQEGTTSIDVSQLTQGAYFLQVILDNGDRLTKKFVKRP